VNERVKLLIHEVTEFADCGQIFGYVFQSY
jgi:hypothetical protein